MLAKNENVTRLDLRHNDLGDAGVFGWGLRVSVSHIWISYVTHMNSHVICVTHLDLRQNDLGDAGVCVYMVVCLCLCVCTRVCVCACVRVIHMEGSCHAHEWVMSRV